MTNIKRAHAYFFATFLISLFSWQTANADAYLQIRNVSSGLCLEVVKGSKAVGALIQQAACKNSAVQNFLAVTQIDGSYVFKNQNSGLCLEVKDGVLGSKVRIQQNKCTSLGLQKFTPKTVKPNEYALISQLDGGCYDIPGASKASGVILQKYVCNETAAQRFNFKTLSGSIPLFLPAYTDPVISPVSGPTLPTIMRGVNLTGAESGNLGDANKLGTNYAYPKTSMIDYFAKKGFTAIRLPFKSSRLQTELGKPLDLVQLAEIDKIVQYARTKGMYVILDPHDYGTMADANNVSQLIGTAKMPARHFADFWGRLARVYSRQPNVVFNIMNEPSSRNDENGNKIYMTSYMWQSAAIAAVSAIRAVGATQLVLIPGSSWTGAHSWLKSGNGTVWSHFRDSNYAFDVHQYLDHDSSGTKLACTVGAGSSASRLQVFTDWAKKYRHRGFVGEMGWGLDTGCLKEGTAMMAHINANSSVYRGWTYFGASWYRGHMTVNPDNFNTTSQKDKPQMTALINSLR